MQTSFNVKYNSENPFIRDSILPYGAPEFAKILPEHFEEAYDWAIAEAKARIEAIKNNPEPPTFENTVAALSFATEELSRVSGIVSVFEVSKSTDEIQEIMDVVIPKAEEFNAEIWMDDALFERVNAVYEQKDTLSLNAEQTILLNDQYNSFVENGISLKGENREKYKQIVKELANTRQNFANNLINHGKKLNLYLTSDEKHRLDGVPEDIISVFKAKAEKDEKAPKGGYVIPMVPPPSSVLESANDRTLREAVLREFSRRGSEGEFDNSSVFKKILELRYNAAQMLGFEHHADRIIKTGNRMTSDYKDVIKFVKTNAESYYPVSEDFSRELETFASKKDGINELKPWDRLYYIQKMREEKLGFDSQAVRPYFELNNVLEGLFAHTEKLYGLEVVRAPEGKYETVNDDVMVFEVSDIGSDTPRALFYADFYSNKDKRGGAWMNPIRSSGMYAGQHVIPIITNDMNLQKPEPGKPTLLTDDNVRTVWHEFGHACHGMLSNGDFPELSGTNTSQDYVELPSQINECWTFKPEVLVTYAFHHETGEVLPQDMVEKLQALELYNVRWQGMRQTEFGLIDMAYYTATPTEIECLKSFEDKVLADYSSSVIKPLAEAPAKALTFLHITEDYSAGYYVYKWADAVVADVREVFEAAETRGEGCYPPELCKAFKENMIVPGGTRPSAQMLADFKNAAGCTDTTLDMSALFRAEGITPKNG